MNVESSVDVNRHFVVAALALHQFFKSRLAHLRKSVEVNRAMWCDPMSHPLHSETGTDQCHNIYSSTGCFTRVSRPDFGLEPRATNQTGSSQFLDLII